MSGAVAHRPLARVLAERLTGRVALVGIGNPLLGDDAAGCELARRLAGVVGLDVVESEDVPERDVFRVARLEPDTVVLTDAVDLCAAPGSVALLDPSALALYTPTTHRVPLSLIATMIERECAADVLVLAIQPGALTPGAGLSADVARSVASLAGIIRETVRVSGVGGEVHAC